MRLPKKIPRGATLRLEFVNCGRCLNQHGPYWYAYWKDYRGVTRSYTSASSFQMRPDLVPESRPRPLGKLARPISSLYLDNDHRDAAQAGWGLRLRRRAPLAY